VAHVVYGSIIATGDVNGDGFDDLAAASASGPFGNGFGGVEVVFGGPALHSLEFFNDSWPTFEGYSIRTPSWTTWIELDGGRDVNGDGYADLVIHEETSADLAWVLFGKSSVESVELPEALGDGAGFSIVPGFEASGALRCELLPDLDDDGLAEIRISVGEETYVVRGKADGLQVELSAVAEGVGGYAQHERPWGSQGAVAWAEIDGSPGIDAVVAARDAPVGELDEAGCTYVYFAPDG